MSPCRLEQQPGTVPSNGVTGCLSDCFYGALPQAEHHVTALQACRSQINLPQARPRPHTRTHYRSSTPNLSTRSVLSFSCSAFVSSFVSVRSRLR